MHPSGLNIHLCALHCMQVDYRWNTALHCMQVDYLGLADLGKTLDSEAGQMYQQVSPDLFGQKE